MAEGRGTCVLLVYDPVGNRKVLNADGELTTSTYDAANRLISAEDVHGVTAYTFDANGNQRRVATPSGDITTYSWSYENQLIQLEEPDDVLTTYVYAPTNRRGEELRISRETDTETVRFVWDDQNLIQEVDETNTIEAEYTLNPQPYGDLISQRRDEESTFYHFDALGSTQSLTDDTGTVENEYTYGAFGKLTSQSGTADNPFTWVGELGYYQDADGRYSLRQREYEDAIARFLSQDPIRSDDGTEFWYADNNPVNVVDPSGRESFCNGLNCTQPIGNQSSSDPVDYSILKDMFPQKGPEVTVAKQDLTKIPTSRVDELLKQKALTGAEELEPQDGRRVVVATMLMDGIPKLVVLVQNVKVEFGCSLGAMPGTPIVTPEQTFAIVNIVAPSYGKQVAADNYFNRNETENLTGKSQLLEAVLKALPFGTAAGAVSGTCEVGGAELVLVTVADSAFLVGSIVNLTRAGQAVFSGTRAAWVARGAVIIDAGQNVVQAEMAANNAINDPTASNIVVAAAITSAILFGVGWKRKTVNVGAHNFPTGNGRKLNLGSGSNPMPNAVNVDTIARDGVDIIGDARSLPFPDNHFQEVHSINPYGFQPVSIETARVMEPGGLLYVSGTERNPYAKSLSAKEAAALGFEIIGSTKMVNAHQYGTQRTVSGSIINTGTSMTTIYRKLGPSCTLPSP